VLLGQAAQRGGAVESGHCATLPGVSTGLTNGCTTNQQ
jgi:hypothetical protein